MNSLKYGFSKNQSSTFNQSMVGKMNSIGLKRSKLMIKWKFNKISVLKIKIYFSTQLTKVLIKSPNECCIENCFRNVKCSSLKINRNFIIEKTFLKILDHEIVHFLIIQSYTRIYILVTAHCYSVFSYVSLLSRCG